MHSKDWMLKMSIKIWFASNVLKKNSEISTRNCHLLRNTTFIENIMDTKTIIMNVKVTTQIINQYIIATIHRYVIKLKHEWRHKLHKERFQWDCIHNMKNFNHEQIDARWYFRLALMEQNIMGYITCFTIWGLNHGSFH